MNYEHLWRLMHSPPGRAFITERASQNIGAHTLRASVKLGELIDAESEHVAAKVAERILEDQGVLKVQTSGGISVNINNTVAAGYVVRLPAAPVQTIDANAPHMLPNRTGDE